MTDKAKLPEDFSGEDLRPGNGSRHPGLLYAVIGNPVDHSLGPVMHNRAFAAVGHNGLYVALRVTDIGGAMVGVRALGIAGLSVTIPHKIGVMAHLDEIEKTARTIGAVNTVVHRDGRLIGINTDADGAVAALEEATPLKGKTVAVIGAGGAARAVGFGVRRKGAETIVVNRTADRGAALARELGGTHVPPEHFDGSGIDILVNTTPVGMAPDTSAMPISAKVLSPKMVVMDAVYNPIRTKLLIEAERIGCRTVDGVSMFVYQGARQFTLWTGEPAPVSVMRKAVVETLQAHRNV
jgi:shikimate dehydrogenase